MKRTVSFLTVLLALFLSVFAFGLCEAKDGKFGKGSSPGEKKTLTVNDVEYTFCWCPPGEFMMGSPETEKGRGNDEVRHHVIITRGFWLLESEVTQQMWESLMGTTIEDQSDGAMLCGTGDLFPMYYVSWEEAQAFCRALSAKSGENILLPTEAQWEYACRAGTGTKYYFGDRDSDIGQNAWYIFNSSENYEFSDLNEQEEGGRWLSLKERSNPDMGTHRVKQKKPNAWGLYDMLGNLWEWCSDWYDEAYYMQSPKTDPQGPSAGSIRVLRGGSWFYDARQCRSAERSWDDPKSRDGYWHVSFLGFRPALVPAEE